MVATGIESESSSRTDKQKYQVVQPVAKAAGSDYEPQPAEETQESLLVTRNGTEGTGDLPLFDFDGDDKLDVPTFLRRQAD